MDETLSGSKSAKRLVHNAKMDGKEDLRAHHVDNGTDSPTFGEKGEHGHRDPILDQFSPADFKAIKKKLDLRLILTLGLMYCVSLMDRTNMPNAAIAGMTVELEMVEPNGIRYARASTPQTYSLLLI
ncbi:hypothetical protein LTR37_001651 [Vermiconidia calcicola]|uniref:Uncharacterized protein n=1 Tax=Vermiconidia calcicola TaxID=1690605 RepID=A0ACC3NVL5_9PEZI|nr:hypothetical protein LTR37_001651 [Vermiconidia calcicola]